ncbi:metalloregulator ArsR/SmtB family transcription factor [Cellulomonas sp. ATA003]|uniref:metalloregulator ArsR/SmtB family transcription factor n=1 Tax=Cellulomonas sp. ATA003 TaxID=3073064 RepID=UPI002873872C|nr:metalloregulator ArsR/SmtB family transcription factor [Cellulomonas sp. ATA003]WNB86225.1 metalloregulator ArsR/SmtB family transcription factor [Cellulomonas sp. ATA003]
MSVDVLIVARYIDLCQWLKECMVTTVRELPVSIQRSVEACCMPLRATALGEADAAVLARRFAALADPVRLRLLSLIATSEDGAVCACDLVVPVGKSQPTVSHHLKVLREAGLVTGEKRGTNVWYAAVPAALEDLRVALGPAGT